MSQLRPVGWGGVSGSTTPLRREAPEESSGRRANSESERRRWRAVEKVESDVGRSVGFSRRLGRGGAWTAEADEGRRLGVPAPERGAAGVEGGGCGPGGDSERIVGTEVVGVAVRETWSEDERLALVLVR